MSKNPSVLSGLGVLLLFVALWFSYVGPTSILGAFVGFASDTSEMECYPLFDLHPETVAYIDRVVSDGGTVIDMNWTDAVIRQSIADGWFDDIWIFVDANMGVRLSSDGSDAYDKLYSIHGSDNDAIASGNSQPRYKHVGDKRVIHFLPDRDTFFTTQISESQHVGGGLTYLGGLITEETYQAILGHSSGNSRGFAHRGHLSQFRFRASHATVGNPTTHATYNSDVYAFGDRHILANRWDDGHVRHFHMNTDYIASTLGAGAAWVNRLGTWGDGRARGDYFMFARILDYLEDDAYTNLVDLYNSYYGLAGSDGAPSSGSPIQDPDWNVLVCVEKEEQDVQCDFNCVEDIDDTGSALDLHPETIAYMERVVSDGGTIVDINWTDTLIRQSISDGWFDDIWIFVDANMGVRLSSEGSDAYDKLYSIHGSDNDAVASGNSRPLSGSVDDRQVIRFSPDRDTFFTTQTSESQHVGGGLTYLGGLITEETYQAILGHSSGNSRGFAHRGHLSQFRFRASHATVGNPTTHATYDSDIYSLGDRHILANRWDDVHVRHFYMNTDYIASTLGAGAAWVNRLGTWGDGRARGDYFMFARILDYLEDDAYNNLIRLYDRYYGLAGNEGSSISLSLLPPSESPEPPEVIEESPEPSDSTTEQPTVPPDSTTEPQPTEPPESTEPESTEASKPHIPSSYDGFGFEFIANVRDYGAVGDGTTDDTQAILHAIDAIHTNGSGILFFGEGDYYVPNWPTTDFSGSTSGRGVEIHVPIFILGQNATLRGDGTSRLFELQKQFIVDGMEFVNWRTGIQFFDVGNPFDGIDSDWAIIRNNRFDHVNHPIMAWYYTRSGSGLRNELNEGTNVHRISDIIIDNNRVSNSLSGIDISWIHVENIVISNNVFEDVVVRGNDVYGDHSSSITRLINIGRDAENRHNGQKVSNIHIYGNTIRNIVNYNSFDGSDDDDDNGSSGGDRLYAFLIYRGPDIIEDNWFENLRGNRVMGIYARADGDTLIRNNVFINVGGSDDTAAPNRATISSKKGPHNNLLIEGNTIMFTDEFKNQLGSHYYYPGILIGNMPAQIRNNIFIGTQSGGAEVWRLSGNVPRPRSSIVFDGNMFFHHQSISGRPLMSNYFGREEIRVKNTIAYKSSGSLFMHGSLAGVPETDLLLIENNYMIDHMGGNRVFSLAGSGTETHSFVIKNNFYQHIGTHNPDSFGLQDGGNDFIQNLNPSFLTPQTTIDILGNTIIGLRRDSDSGGTYGLRLRAKIDRVTIANNYFKYADRFFNFESGSAPLQLELDGNHFEDITRLFSTVNGPPSSQEYNSMDVRIHQNTGDFGSARFGVYTMNAASTSKQQSYKTHSLHTAQLDSQLSLLVDSYTSGTSQSHIRQQISDLRQVAQTATSN